jgi:folate-binding protein YgfZ
LNPIPPSGPTVLRLEGRDALTILQRISSQHLEDLAAGAARTTLFCDFRGRTLHRATVAHTTDGAAWLLRDDAPGAELLAHVDRHVFREDVKIADLSSGWSMRAEWTGDDAPGIQERDGVPFAVPEGRGFRLVLAPAGVAEPADAGRLELERVTRGRPRHGHEIHEDFNPYEIGCADEVHLSKGCYTGQEALQRLVTYASVRRLPALARGRGAPPETPGRLVAAGGDAGRLTSATRSDASGEWIGIAIVRKNALAATSGGEVSHFEIEGGAELTALVPYPERHPLGRALAD